MEENIEKTTENEGIAPELLKTIKAKIAELKEADPKLKIVFPIVVEGGEYDEKENYVGYFRQPSFTTFSKYLTISQKGDQAVAMRTLANDCFIGGDKELVDDDSLFLFGLMGQLGRIIEMRNARLVNFSKTGK